MTNVSVTELYPVRDIIPAIGVPEVEEALSA